MSAFPSVNVLGNPTVTTAAYQAAIEAFLASTKQLPGGIAGTNLTISGGNITPVGAFHRVDTQGAAATDDLDHAIVTNLPQGSILILASVSSARDVTIRNAIAGSGQFLTATGASFTLADVSMFIAFVREGSDTWVEVFRSYGNQASAARTNLGLGTVAVLNQGATGAGVPQSQDIIGRRSKDFKAQDFTSPPSGGASGAGIYTPSPFIAADGFGMITNVNQKYSAWFFSDTVGNEIFTQWYPPKRWDKGNVFWELYWASQNGIVNGVRWGISMQAFSSGDVLSTNFASEGGVTQTSQASGAMTVTSEVTVTVGGSPADRDFINIRVRRVPSDGGDTMADVAVLLGARMLYNINALRDN